MAEKPKTVRVRIAVAVDAKGRYQVDGWKGATDEVIAANAAGYHMCPPLPESTTIEGEASDD